MRRCLFMLLIMSSFGCHTSMAVGGSSLQSAVGQACMGTAPEEADPYVFRDRAGRIRIAAGVDRNGAPSADKTIIIDRKTEARWETGWQPVCTGGDTSHVQQIQVRRYDAGSTYGAIGGGVGALFLVVGIPLLWIGICGLHGC